MKDGTANLFVMFLFNNTILYCDEWFPNCFSAVTYNVDRCRRSWRHKASDNFIMKK